MIWMITFAGIGAIAMFAVKNSPNENAFFIVATLIISCIFATSFFIARCLRLENEQKNLKRTQRND